MAVPPAQTKGAPVPLFVIIPLQPPLAETVANQAVYFALIVACDWQATSTTFAGHVKTTGAGAGTVKVAVQVVVNGAHLLV